MRTVYLAILLAASAAAQVSTPLVGWLPDGTEIRPMNGLPAAATLGPAVNTGHLLAGVAVSPAQNYVLATATDTRQVLLIRPGVSATPLNAPPNPDQIVISPSGSAAALWYGSAYGTTAQVEIVSGLPASPAVRQINVGNFTAPTALAVSDDGQWFAAASSSGAYVWGSSGSSQPVYSGNDAGAIAFFAGNSNLALATSTQLLSISNGAATVLDQGTFSPAGLAVSSDNQKIVYADQNGAIDSINAATGAVSTFACQCRPGGVFGLGNEVFRLTTSNAGPVELFDASAGAVLAVPRGGLAPKRSVHPAGATAPLPTLTINLSPFPNGYLQQPSMTLTASAAYSTEIDGTVTLTFASSVGGTDDTIQFSTGGTTVNFTIPAGSTQANFSGASSITLSTGTVAGTTTLTAAIASPTAVSSAATQSFTTNPTVPFISTVTFTATPGLVTVVITGFASTRDVNSAVFDFAPSSNATINQTGTPPVTDNTVTVPVSSYPIPGGTGGFQVWFASSTSYATGGEFTLTVPFSVSGNSDDVVAVTVTLINSVGASIPVSPK
jgi:hypothetical protein